MYHLPNQPPSESVLLLKITSTRDTGITHTIARSYDPAIVVAAKQLIAHQERHGSDAVPPEDVFAAWLDENAEDFIQATKAKLSLSLIRSHSRSRNLGTTIPSTGSLARPVPGRGSASASLSPSPSNVSSDHASVSATATASDRSAGSQDDEEEEEGEAEGDVGSVLGLLPFVCRCRRQICWARRRICEVLGRVGAAVYAADAVELPQLDAFERDVADRDEEEIPDGVGRGYGARRVTLSSDAGSEVQGLELDRDQNAASASASRLFGDSNRYISNQQGSSSSKLHPASRLPTSTQDAFVLRSIGESRPSTTTPPATELEPEYPEPFELAAPSTVYSRGRPRAAARDRSTRATREAAPSPPDQRGRFHISQVAHLAPSHVAAERSRLRLEGLLERDPDQGRLQLHTQSQNQSTRSDDSSGIGTGIGIDINKAIVADRDTTNREALRRRIQRSGLLRGEAWVEGLDGLGEDAVERRVGVRFVARPIGMPVRRQLQQSQAPGYRSMSGSGAKGGIAGALSMARKRKSYGLGSSQASWSGEWGGEGKKICTRM
ncbi:hypothetical protein GGR54DRAFT_10940 [Hypoxylon sp. NC1633]|nr:hypothetical protein GGR54DRAFT_10940 [Hypoxylon sp. NC1633]